MFIFQTEATVSFLLRQRHMLLHMTSVNGHVVRLRQVVVEKGKEKAA